MSNNSRIQGTEQHAPNIKLETQLAFYALFVGAVSIAFAPIFVRLSPLPPSATAFWHWSIKFTSVANATLLANFAPIFVVLGGRILYKQSVHLPFITGMFVAILGTVILIGAKAQITHTSLLGDGLGVVTAFFYGSYILTVSRLRQRFSTATIMSWSGVVTSITLFMITLVSGERIFTHSINGWLVLLALALVSQFGGQSLIAFALARLPAAFSSVGLLIQPTMATIFAWMILGEKINLIQGVGGLIAIAGIFLARKATEIS